MVIAGAAPADRRAAHRRLAAVVSSPETRARHLALAADAPDEAVAQLVTEAARACAHAVPATTAPTWPSWRSRSRHPARAAERRDRVLLAAEQRFAARDPGRARALLEDLLPAVPGGLARAEVLRRLTRYRVFSGEPLAVGAATCWPRPWPRRAMTGRCAPGSSSTRPCW